MKIKIDKIIKAYDVKEFKGQKNYSYNLAIANGTKYYVRCNFPVEVGMEYDATLESYNYQGETKQYYKLTNSNQQTKQGNANVTVEQYKEFAVIIAKLTKEISSKYNLDSSIVFGNLMNNGVKIIDLTKISSTVDKIKINFEGELQQDFDKQDEDIPF